MTDRTHALLDPSTAARDITHVSTQAMSGDQHRKLHGQKGYTFVGEARVEKAQSISYDFNDVPPRLAGTKRSLQDDQFPHAARHTTSPPSPSIANAEDYDQFAPNARSSETHQSNSTADHVGRTSQTLPRDPHSRKPSRTYRGPRTTALTRNQSNTSAKSRPKWEDPSHTPAAPLGSLSTQQLLRQPESRPISEEQLAVEVKSIYAGLAMVESKCMHVDKAQAMAIKEAPPGAAPGVLDDHWQALIALHRTLLHEHHDFFLASQHPTASQALQRLAAKYSMPARMWKHGIHSFLELLRQRLPHSKEYMLAFIYLAYQMMALLYETVPSFLDTWIECLGDLARYRMAIENEDIEDREHWTGVARAWYNKAARRNPAVGRLYHHLAILARPNIVQQLSLYCRALTVVQPFLSARESVETFCDPTSHASPVYTKGAEAAFVRAHCALFNHNLDEECSSSWASFLQMLDDLILRDASRFRETGVYMAVINIAALTEYGAEGSELRTLFELHYKDVTRRRQPAIHQQPPREDNLLAPNAANFKNAHPPSEGFLMACKFTFSTLSRLLWHRNNNQVLPHIHIIFAFLWCVLNIDPESSHPYVTILLGHVPWREVSDFLNHTLAASRNIGLEYEVTGFPVYEGESARPLSEDAQIDGQGWSCDYYSKDWLPKEVSDDDDPLHEPPSVTNARRQRILWLGVKFAQCGRCGIEYNSARKSWSVSGTVSAHRQVELSAEPLQVDRDIHMGPKQSTYQGQRTAYSEAESVDVDMPDVDDFVERRTSDHSSEDDSPEMKEIQERQPRGAA